MLKHLNSVRLFGNSLNEQLQIMKNRISDNIKAFLSIVVLTILMGMINGIPWWSFLFAVVLFGAFAAFRNWKISVFPVGFFAGLLVWTGLNFCYHTVYGGTAFKKIGMLFSLNEWLIYILSGLIGGLLTTLALYSGISIIRKNQPAAHPI